MNKRAIAIWVIIAALLMGMLTIFWNAKESSYIDLIIEAQGGSCYIEEGVCLHSDRDYTLVIIGWILSGLILVTGIYLLFFDKTQKALAEQQVKVSTALERAMEKEKEKDEFHAFLSGFDEDTQKVLKAVKEQEGIKQSTLRFRTGLSKTGLSLMLNSLEKKGIVSRKVSGKTKEVYIQKKF